MKSQLFAVRLLLVVVGGVMAPIAGVALMALIPYATGSIIVEELLKAVAVLVMVNWFSRSTALWASAAFGALFGIMEWFLYSPAFIAVNVLWAEWGRMGVTVPLHIITVVGVTIAGLYNKWYIIPTMMVMMVLHWLFNMVVG